MGHFGCGVHPNLKHGLFLGLWTRPNFIVLFTYLSLGKLILVMIQRQRHKLRAGTVSQEIMILPAMLASPIGVLVHVPAALLLIQHPAAVRGEA